MYTFFLKPQQPVNIYFSDFYKYVNNITCPLKFCLYLCGWWGLLQERRIKRSSFFLVKCNV